MNRIPNSTYRLQLSTAGDFNAVRRLLDYLQLLGISDLYLSPLFRSRESSSHGYDVVSHSEIDPSFGSRSDFHHLADDARGRGMGILLDVVPNHMGINDPQNEWWFDVLANGPLSRFARCFDIDWDRPDERLRNKLLLPLLGDYFGDVLERGELRLAYDRGRFQLCYGEMQLPVNAFSWVDVLAMTLKKLTAVDDSTTRTELESILTQLRNLPGRELAEESAAREREREQSVAAERLAKLVGESKTVGDALQAAIADINGEVGNPASFDRLESLLAAQWYRLAYWRVAADEINYRRFFDIDDLAAIRVELPEVFDQAHALVFELLAAGRITGLRIDHPDGLYDPQLYFETLQKRFREVCPAKKNSGDHRLYVVAEKILTGKEQLPEPWPVAGTTGYELLNHISQLLVDADGLEALRATHDEFIAEGQLPAHVIYESKRQILHDSLASELTMLASRLHRLAQSSRRSSDFTFPSLLRALREVIACFPVYRTYIRSQGWEVDAEEHGRISQAVRLAKRRNPAMPRAVFDFISAVLRLEFPPTLERPAQEKWREFTLRFQQVTGPVTAKGIEDTAFYRYFPLASLNEVGGEIDLPSLSLAEFHGLMQRRAAAWPHALSATATHDTKRGEDMRARLHVLSEVPAEWRTFATNWNWKVAPLVRDVDGQPAPDPLERYLILQTLVGTWPAARLGAAERENYVGRIRQYMTKAMREAKRNTSWVDPWPEYEEAVMAFIGDVVDETTSWSLIEEVDHFVATIARSGYVNSLAQLTLKATLPGVPDFYQGTELWDFHLVDPDNRRPVDFEKRRRLLTELQQAFAADAAKTVGELSAGLPEERLKLFTTWRLLATRNEYAKLLADGDYLPLEAHGQHAANVISFARSMGNEQLVVVVPRHLHKLLGGGSPMNIDWGDTEVILPSQSPIRLTNQLTQAELETDGNGRLAVSNALRPLPIAVLHTTNALENST